MVKQLRTVILMLTVCACTRNSLSSNNGRFDLDPKIMDALLGKGILLIGETHQKARSFVLVSAILNRALETHRCVALAVEIPSDQQQALDSVRAGTGAIEQVEIWNALDFEPYREFLDEVLRESARQPCFRVRAVDLPASLDGNRDTWIAQQIVALHDSSTVVIALLGTLHVVRGIRYTSHPDERNVVDQLLAARITVNVLAQDWPSKCTPGLIRSGTKAYAAFIDDINRIINGAVSLTEGPPFDAVFNWCE